MKIYLQLGLLTALLVLLPSSVNAQSGLFSGRGISGTLTNNNEVVEEGPNWPSLKDFSLGEPPRLFNFGGNAQPGPISRLFSGDGPKFKLFQQREPGTAMGNLGLPTFNEIFPPRDPNRPGFFQQFNQKSKNFVDRTTTWAQQQNDNFRARTYETWDSITRGFGRSNESTGQVRPMFPNLRTAITPESGSKIKF